MRQGGTAIHPVARRDYTDYFVEKTRRLFRGEAPDWQYEIELIADGIRRFKRGNKLLEIGCGVGTVLFALSREGLDCHGVDFDPLQIASAEALGLELGTGSVKFIAARTEDLSFPLQSFDVIVSRDVAEHLPDEDLRAYLERAYDLLREEGILVLHTKPLKYSYLHEREWVWLVLPFAYLGRRVRRRWLKTLDIVVPRVYRALAGRAMADTWQQKPPGHCNCHDKTELLATLGRAGFVIETARLFVPANRRYFQLLVKLMPFETTQTNILVVARKPRRVD